MYKSVPMFTAPESPPAPERKSIHKMSTRQGTVPVANAKRSKTEPEIDPCCEGFLVGILVTALLVGFVFFVWYLLSPSGPSREAQVFEQYFERLPEVHELYNTSMFVDGTGILSKPHPHSKDIYVADFTGFSDDRSQAVPSSYTQLVVELLVQTVNKHREFEMETKATIQQMNATIVTLQNNQQEVLSMIDVVIANVTIGFAFIGGVSVMICLIVGFC